MKQGGVCPSNPEMRGVQGLAGKLRQLHLKVPLLVQCTAFMHTEVHIGVNAALERRKEGRGHC